MGCTNSKDLKIYDDGVDDGGRSKIDLLSQLESGTLASKNSKFENFPEFKSDSVSKIPKFRTQIDSRVTSKYDIKALIGKGSFSDVLRVNCKTSNEPYAIKIVKVRTIQEKEVINAEVQSLQGIEHPYIIKLHEVIISKDCTYIIMDLATGGELYDRIKSRGKLDEKYSCNITQMILNGLRYLHSNGIIHRDLKPENLLFYHPGQDSKIIITDFGFSKKIGNEELSKTWCGTPEYIAPELILKKPYGKKVDVWALGVIVFVMLSGHLPFSADTTPKLFKQIVDGSFSFSRVVWDTVSTMSKDFICQLLKINCEDRFDIEQASSHVWISSFPLLHKPKIPKKRKQRQRIRLPSNTSDLNNLRMNNLKRLSVDYAGTVKSENSSGISSVLRGKRQLNNGLVLPFSGGYAGNMVTKDAIFDDSGSSMISQNVDSMLATEDTNSVLSNLEIFKQFYDKYSATADPLIREQMKESYEQTLLQNNLKLPVHFSAPISEEHLILPNNQSQDAKESLYQQFENIDEDSGDEVQVVKNNSRHFPPLEKSFNHSLSHSDYASFTSESIPIESDKLRYIEKVGVWLNESDSRKITNKNYSRTEIDPDNLISRRSASGKSAVTVGSDNSNASSFNRFLLPTQSRKQIQTKHTMLSPTSSQHSRHSSNHTEREILDSGVHETSFSSSYTTETPLILRNDNVGTSFA